MTSFLGIGAKGAGEVLTMPLSGGKLKPLVKGFVGPTVGLGGHDGWLYVGQVGDATHPGLVYRVKL